MVFFNPTQSAAYTANEAADLGNIRFYAGRSELYSWCESGCNSITSTNAVFWVNIPSGIGASSSIVINMTFLSNSMEYDGVYAGEAPQLTCSNPSSSSTCSAGGGAIGVYGKFDNGNSVFSFYNNFAGNSGLPSNFVPNTVTTYTVSNGLSTSTGTISTLSPVFASLNNVLEAYMSFASSGNGALSESNTNSIQAGNGAGNKMALFFSSPAVLFYASDGSAYDICNGCTSFTSTTGMMYVIGTAVGSANVYAYQNYVVKNGVAGTFSSNQYILLGDQHGNTGAAAASLFFQWVRVRSLPPGGTMPTFSIGAQYS